MQIIGHSRAFFIAYIYLQSYDGKICLGKFSLAETVFHLFIAQYNILFLSLLLYSYRVRFYSIKSVAIIKKIYYEEKEKQWKPNFGERGGDSSGCKGSV